MMNHTAASRQSDATMSMAMDTNHSQEMSTDVDMDMMAVKDDETTWDPQACVNPQWSTDNHHHEAKRLQDLQLGGLGGSVHQPNAGTDNNNNNHHNGTSSTWPFESSPCRWNGGKNTRPSAANDAMNQSLFDPDFAHKASFEQGSILPNENDIDSMEIEGEHPKVKSEFSSRNGGGGGRRDNSCDEEDEEVSGSSDIDSETSTEFANDDDEEDEVEDEGDGEDESSSGSFCDDDGGRESKGAVYVVPVMETRTSCDTAGSRTSTADARRSSSRRDGQSSRETGRGPSGSSSRSRRTSNDPMMDVESQPSTSKRASSSSQRSSRSSSAGGSKGTRQQHPVRSQLKQDDYIDSKRRSSPAKTHYNNMLAYYNPEGGQGSTTFDKANSSKGDNSTSRRRVGSSSHGDPRSRDELSASCHGQVERKSSSSGMRSSSSRRRGADELSSATFHGPVSQSRAGPSSSLSTSLQGGSHQVASSSSRVPPARTRSSDGAELGAATLHGGSSISRIRSGKRRPPSTSSEAKSSASQDSGSSTASGSKSRGGKPGERRMLQRAMSIRNVKRPEEYATGQGGTPATMLGSSAQDATAASIALKSSDVSGGSSTRAGLTQRSSSVRNLTTSSSRSSKGNSRLLGEDTASDVAMEDGTPAPDHVKSSRPSSSTRTASHRASAQPTQQHQAVPRTSNGDTATSVITPGSMSSMSTASSSGPPRRRAAGMAVSTPTAAVAASTSTEPASRARDLLLLLRDRKKVTQNDVLDKENRRLLHYLMMEHKMGVSPKDLYQVVRADAAGTEAVA